MRRTVYRDFIYCVAAICGLFIFAAVALFGIGEVQTNGFTIKGLVLLVGSVFTGLGSWRETIRLNLKN